MVERVQSGVASGRGPRFTAADFRVPGGYLPLLVGAEAAQALAGGAPSDAPMPSTRFLTLCLEHMRATGDEACGAAPVRAPQGTFGLLLAAAAQGDTFAQALQRFADAVPMLRPDMIVGFSRTRRGLEISFGHRGERDPRRDLLVEIFALTAHCGLRWLTGRRLPPVFLRVQPATPPMGPTLLRPVVSPTALRRGRGVTIGYALADGALPLRAVKYQRWAAHELGEFNALLDEAARVVERSIPGPPPGIVAQVQAVIGPDAWGEPVAARALGMSTATLRRRLSDEGTSFRTVASDMRRAAARSLLATEHSLDDIAARLGFSDSRSFRRACQGWFGMAPAEYRRQQR